MSGRTVKIQSLDGSFLDGPQALPIWAIPYLNMFLAGRKSLLPSYMYLVVIDYEKSYLVKQ